MPELHRPTRRGVVPALFLATGVLLLAAGCGGKKTATAFTPPPVPVEVAEAVRGDVKETLHALGTVEAEEQVKVTVEIDAIVRALPFEEGGLVRKGQTLAVLDDTELRAEARRAAAIRDQARLTFERFD